jgi:hypothetical protein
MMLLLGEGEIGGDDERNREEQQRLFHDAYSA